jgi:hypothetical protein
MDGFIRGFMQKFILSNTTLTLQIERFEKPITFTLKSSDASRKLEVSTDGGTSYFEPPLDIEESSFIVLVIAAPITNVKATGVALDELIEVT